MKKVIAISIITAMVVCNSMTVWAADEDNIGTNGGSKSHDVNATYTVNSDFNDKNNDNVPGVDEKGDGEDTYIDENGDGTILTPTAATYSVDIVWGDMNFVFQAGKTTWDSENHVYKPVDGEEGKGTWTPKVIEPLNQASNRIEVTNNSNVAILTEVTYKPKDNSIYTDVIGMLKNACTGGDQINYTLTKGVSSGGTTTEEKEDAFVIKDSVNNTDISKTGYLQLTGNPDSSWTTDENIGSVTVTINYAIVN